MTSLLRATTVVSSLTLLSRLLGFARDLIMFRAFGAGPITGTFVLAWTLPNTMRRWFGEGALSAAFVPAYARLLAQQQRAEADRLLGGVCGALLLILGSGSLLLASAAWLWPAAAGGDGEGVLLRELAAILVPYVVPICLVAVLGGALNAWGSFGAPAAAPALLNLFWIAGIGLAAWLYGLEPVPSIRLLAVALLAGGVAQLLATAIPLARRGALPWPRLPGRGEPARGVFAAMLPTAFGLSVAQLTVLVNQLFAWTLLDPSANSFVYLADRIVLFPHGLTALALATAVFPRFAELAVQPDRAMLRGQVERSLQAVLFLAIPAAAGLVLLAPELFRIGFVGERFTTSDAELAATTTSALAIGLPFLGLAQLAARALYALGDLRAPARAACIVFGVNLLLAPLLALGAGFGVAGLTLAMSVGAMLNAALLFVQLRRHCGGLRLAPASLWRIAGAVVAMQFVVVLTGGRLGLEGRLGEAVDQLLIPIAAGICAFLSVAHLLGSQELRLLRRRRGAALSRSA